MHVKKVIKKLPSLSLNIVKNKLNLIATHISFEIFLAKFYLFLETMIKQQLINIKVQLTYLTEVSDIYNLPSVQLEWIEKHHRI